MWPPFRVKMGPRPASRTARATSSPVGASSAMCSGSLPVTPERWVAIVP
jgi:hypothetical protein